MRNRLKLAALMPDQHGVFAGLDPSLDELLTLKEDAAAAGRFQFHGRLPELAKSLVPLTGRNLRSHPYPKRVDVHWCRLCTDAASDQAMDMGVVSFTVMIASTAPSLSR